MNDNVPNKDSQQVVEDAFDKLQAGEQTQESTPETEQVETQPEGGSDPLKTQSTTETADDKGFANHPKWMERETKLKEARELLKQRDSEREQYSKLLADPQAYAQWRKQNGYSEEKKADGPQAQSIAEKACSKLGWDINRLNPEQKAYINDSVSLTMAIIEEAVRPMIEERVRPMEGVSNEWNQQKQFNTEETGVMKLAKDEFPEADFEEVIKPAISKFLAELDEKDPQRTIKLSYEDIYYRATRPLLRELEQTKGRQEVRNANKANLRPLGTGVTTKTEEKPVKLKPRDFLDKTLDGMGIR